MNQDETSPTPTITRDATYWNRKLALLLHDSPSKSLDIPSHEDRSQAAFQRAGLTEDTFYDSKADHLAAAADRFPFPSRAAKVRCKFDGQRNGFHHPLGGGVLRFEPFPSTDLAEELEQAVQPGEISMPEHWTEAEQWRARYFAHWRLWLAHAAERDHRFAFLPADTRLPDHTIWNHMQVTSALGSCKSENQLKPAFLQFKIGGVQSFISEARSTRDLWSGSYLLSWLMAVGLKKLSELAGPDAVIFPALFSQPLFDLQWKDELWDHLKISARADATWRSLGHSEKDLTTPNLVNTFLAVVPTESASAIAQAVAAAMKDEWQRISRVVWTFADNAGCWNEKGNQNLPLAKETLQDRWNQQVEAFLQPEWQMLPWPETLDEACALGESLPQNDQLASTDQPKPSSARVRDIRRYAEQELPKEHRDSRYYQKPEPTEEATSSKEKLLSVSTAWSVLYDASSWCFEATRQAKTFTGKPSPRNAGTHCNKDSLNGRDEAIAGGPGWRKQMEGKGEPWERLFKHDDWVGAITFIKRVWSEAYLEKEWNLTRPRMPDIPEISKDSGGYFAVLALDGDEMGKWISGAKNPAFREQLANYEENGQQCGVIPYLEKALNWVLDVQRPVSPSFHLQFSECLANFALRCARRIVEAHHGLLLYAGGDDVLAVLPATSALPCAEDLQSAFRGQSTPHKQTHLHRINPDGTTAKGFLVNERLTQSSGKPQAFTVPGPSATCSVGIAVAHEKNPLQDVVRAAQAAEKRAKQQLGRNAVAVNLLKRSGEAINWGCAWPSGGLDLYHRLAEQLTQGSLSHRFPYRVIELLQLYLNVRNDLVTGQTVAEFETREIIKQEFAFALQRQSRLQDKTQKEQSEQLLECLDRFLAGTEETWNKLIKDGHDRANTSHGSSTDFLLQAVIGLCQTLAFIHRQS